ncbi:restriction endonuclease [Pontibacterium sp.]|uniref:restriction endonuclease n=1 Tax=Pontibacterium sp. TaxID=2036026 RepID=UPI003517E991
MAIDYKRLGIDGEDFELLCRDVLESYGAVILSEPTRGPDQKKDLVIEIISQDALGNTERVKYLVQCKHKAHSGKSVLESDIGDFRSACLLHETDGYFLITSTIPSVTVSNNLNA